MIVTDTTPRKACADPGASRPVRGDADGVAEPMTHCLSKPVTIQPHVLIATACSKERGSWCELL